MKKKTIRSERGSAMIWALIVLVVVMVAASSVVMVQDRDSKETIDLENRLTHYYVALAGLEYGYAALMTDYDSGRFATYYATNMAADTLNSTYDLVVDGENVGKADVKIYMHALDGEDWIVVESKGKIQSLEGDRILYMRVHPKDLTNVIKDGDRLPTTP